MRNVIVLFILVLLSIPKLSGAQATSITVGGTTSSLSATYNTATTVDPNLTITSNGDITGFRVQISQSYISGDVLDYTGTLPTGITATWNSTTGILSFNGTTTASNWQTLLRTVRFKSTSTTCYANLRRVTFVAGTVYYNPLTEHYYEYVAGSILWTNSKTAAEAKSYFGRVGYLATMASEAENNFIWKLMSSDAWFGASDDYTYVNAALGTTTYASQAAVEGKWYWISGPEKGTNFSNGNGTPVTVSGQYAKWAGGEPNNSGGEHYGQFYSSNSGQWNDLPNTTLGGYICEYGDMPGDLTSSVTIFTREISVGNGSSGTISGGDINVCSGSNSTTLTLNNMTGSVVRWESSYDNFFTAGTTISNTTTSLSVSNITKTTYYRAIVNSTSPVSCSSLPSSSVFLSVKPTKSGSIFAANNTVCTGGLVELTLSGQQGSINKWQRSSDNVNWSNISNTTTTLNETVYALGNGLNTDGSNDYITIPKSISGDFTIEYWVKTTQTSLTGTQWYNGNGIVDAEVGGTTTDFGTSMLNGKLAFGVGSPDITIQSTTSINTGIWTHVAVTWNQSTGAMKLYINGQLEATGTSGTGSRTAPPAIRIGSIQTGIQYFSGSIDELRIWNTVRSQTDIQNNMNTEVATSSSLLSYYKFNQGTANGTNTGTTTLSDNSGNGNNGTLYNFGLTSTSSNWVDGLGAQYYYRVEVQTPNCGSAIYSTGKLITVTSGTPPVGGSVSSYTHTSTTNSGTLTLSGYSGTIVKWQKSTNDGVTWTDITNTTSSYSYSNITTKTLFRAQLQSGTCGFAYSSNGVVLIITETITGTVTIPSGLTIRPQLSLYVVDSNTGTETLIQTVTVSTTGTFTLNPTKYNSTYKIVPSFSATLTSNDFNLIFDESKNENTPTNLLPGLVLNSGIKMKSADIDEDGKVTIVDAYLVAVNISGVKTFNKVLWFLSTDFNSITSSNFNSVNSVNYFVVNFGTTSTTLNIKYIVKGDADLSHSSN